MLLGHIAACTHMHSHIQMFFTLHVNTNELLHNTLKWGVSSLKAGCRMTLIGMTIQSSTTSMFSHLNDKFVNNNKHPHIIDNKIQHPYVLKPHTNVGYNGTMCTIEIFYM